MISRTALHAVNALTQMTHVPPGEFVGAAVLAERIEAPPNYLGKLLAGLASEGLLESRKGMGGGFCLARPADEITLLDVVDPIDHLSRWTDCFLGWDECSEDSPCPMHEHWKEVRSQYLEMLRSTSLADLAARLKGSRRA